MDMNEIKKEGDELIAEMRAVKLDIEKRAASLQMPVAGESASNFRSVKEGMVEKRAITMNGNGAINQVSEIVKEITAKTPLLQMVKYFYGPNAQTNIPLLTPGLAAPATASEGYTSGSTDSTAVLTKVTVTPVPYISTLPVSWEAINLNSANFDAELPSLFAGVYGQAMHNVIVDALFASGGVATANKLDALASGLPKMADAAKLALTIKDYSDSAVMVMSPTVYASLIADATTGVAQIYKEELVRNKTIEGVKVVLTSRANSDTTAGKSLIVAGDLSNFGMGVASDLRIEPKTKVGDGNVYYDAVLSFAGAVIQPKNLFAIVAIAE